MSTKRTPSRSIQKDEKHKRRTETREHTRNTQSQTREGSRQRSHKRAYESSSSTDKAGSHGRKIKNEKKKLNEVKKLLDKQVLDILNKYLLYINTAL
ncbi:MAG: hypothetical protein HRT42_06310 [Campylobacteraceae bacterium]|nr:hypothetical protein [Campylobacteraceae bacterium]